MQGLASKGLSGLGVFPGHGAWGRFVVLECPGLSTTDVCSQMVPGVIGFQKQALLVMDRRRGDLLDVRGLG